MNIIMITCLIGTLCIFNLIFAKDLKYFSHFKPGSSITLGHESAVTDFVMMTNKPGFDLPNEFTICTSIIIEILTTMQHIFTIMKEDGTHWFSISYTTLNEAVMNEAFFYCVQTGKYKPMFHIFTLS